MLPGVDNEGYLIITIASMDYALPVAEVLGITALRRSAVYPVPFGKAKHVEGIFNFNASVVALICPKGFSSRLEDRRDESLTAVLLHYGEKQFAVLVEQARAITEAPPDGVLCISAQTLYGGECDDDNK